MYDINQQKYNELVSVCDTGDVFYYQDFEKDNHIFRIFNYRLASWSDWQVHPLSFWMRGLMIEIDNNADFVRVASRPMKKFFNLGENPDTLDLMLKRPGRVEEKLDGSLISTYVIGDQLFLKSKGSLSSRQALDAMAWLDLPENEEFKNALTVFASNDLTIDMEWTAPHNRIVVGYRVPMLTVLGVRCNHTGMETHPEKLFKTEHVVQTREVKNVEFFLGLHSDDTSIEGFVVDLGDGTKFKYKVDWYVNLHRAKDSISSPKKVVQVILNDSIDDLRSLFADDDYTIEMLDRMTSIVKNVYNGLCARIDSWYNENKNLDRKSYAIKGQQEMHDCFGLVMSKYLGKEVNVGEFIMKNFDTYFPDVVWYSLEGTTQ